MTVNGTRFNYEDYAWQPPAPQAGDDAYFFTTPSAGRAPAVPSQSEPPVAFVAKPQDGVMHRPVGELISDSVLSKPVGELIGRRRRSAPGAA